MSWCETENLALCARTFKGLTHDCDPTMVCDPNGCLSRILPVTLDERIRRQIIQRPPAWRTVLAVLSAPSHNLTTQVGTSFQIRTTRQQTPRVRSDRVVSVSEHVWVSMKADRIDQWRFFSCCSVRRCLGKGGTRSDAHTRRRSCRCAKDTFERLAYACEEGCGRHAAFTW